MLCLLFDKNSVGVALAVAFGMSVCGNVQSLRRKKPPLTHRLPPTPFKFNETSLLPQVLVGNTKMVACLSC